MKYVHCVDAGRLAIRAGPRCKPWDLDELPAAGFQRIVSLDTREVDRAAIEKSGMEHVVVKLDDSRPTTPKTRAEYFAAIDQVLALLARDGSAPKQTLVHCYAGFERSPTVGACYLISQGMGPGDAIRKVSQMTGGFEYNECKPLIWEWQARRGRPGAP